MQNRLINLSILINEYKDRVYDLINYACLPKQRTVKDELFCETFIDIFKSIKNTRVKYPVHLVVYDKTKDVVCKDKRTTKKRAFNIKELKAPVDISSIHPVDLKGINVHEILEYLDPKDRLIAMMAIRHRANINELATIFSTSTGAILIKLGRIRTELARAIYSTLKNPKDLHQHEISKLCFSTRNMEPQYSLGLLSKEEQSKISRHISKCTACKNFYTWNERINDLIGSANDEKAPDRSNNMIFERLEGKVIDDTAIHYVRTGWKTRLVILSVLLLSAAGIYYYFMYQSKAQPANSTATQAAAGDVVPVAEYRTVIKINIPTPLSEMDKTKTSIKEIMDLFSYTAGHSEQNINQDELRQEFNIEKQSKVSLLEKIKEFKDTTISEELVNEKAPDDIIKVELNITPNGS